MPTIIIDRVEVLLTLEQLINAVRQLSPEDRERMRRELASPVGLESLETLIQRIRDRAEQSPLSEQEINTEVEVVRDARYRQSGR